MGELEQLIRAHVTLGRRSSTGFEAVKCAVCNDYKVRGGFKFENGQLSYHCFNCSRHNNAYEDNTRISREFREVLTSFGISNDLIDDTLAKKFFAFGGLGVIKKREGSPVVNKDFITVELPPGSYPLSDASESDEWALVAVEYLAARKLAPISYSWYLSSDPAYRSRIIVPYYLRGQIIYWQARAMDDRDSERYLNPSIGRDNIIFNMDALSEHSSKPLYVCEGAFDAITIGDSAISLLGSTLSSFKLNALRKVSGREVVFIIDVDEHALNGYKLAQTAIENGWSITYLTGCKDANQALIDKGKLWMLGEMNKNKASGLQAKVQLEVLFARQIKEEKEQKKNERRKAKTAAAVHSQRP
jgi:hypothetical protein